MSFSDFREIVFGDLPIFDLAIIGSGPAGMTIANEFLGLDNSVLLLESGGNRRDSISDELNRFECVGSSRKPHMISRCRGVGGTSQLWTGQCGIMEEIDYEKRDWIPFSGWPISKHEVGRYIDRAASYLGINPFPSECDVRRNLLFEFDHPYWREEFLSSAVYQYSKNVITLNSLLDCEAEEEIDHELLSDFMYHGASKAMDFGTNYIDAIKKSRNVHLIKDATVFDILVDNDVGNVSVIKAISREKEVIEFKATKIVVACGGIENARLLLNSNSQYLKGLGNGNDQVGRFLADHPSASIAHYNNGEGTELRRRLGERWHKDFSRSCVYRVGPRLSPKVQRREKLLNASYSFTEHGGLGNALSDLAAGFRGIRDGQISATKIKKICRSIARPTDLFSGAVDRFVRRWTPVSAQSNYTVWCFVEQKLDPESRVELSRSKDAFGFPIAKIDWRISEDEFHTAKRCAEIFYDELKQLGYSNPIRPLWLEEGFLAWKQTLTDRSHPMCTTRMSLDPRFGVVDSNCKVHGVNGLYVAGGSVFPTPGFVNPTQMIVALSIRLADHLKTEFGVS